jgi:Integrase core domain
MAKSMGIHEVLTAPQSPWQNAYLERLIGSIRRECLDHVIVLNETGVRRVLKSYFAYYEQSRTHLSLGKDAPISRPIQPPAMGRVVQIPQVGGLHHRYERLAPEQTPLFAYSRRGDVVRLLFCVVERTHPIGSRRTQPARTIGGTLTPPNEFERSFWYGQALNHCRAGLCSVGMQFRSPPPLRRSLSLMLRLQSSKSGKKTVARSSPN